MHYSKRFYCNIILFLFEICKMFSLSTFFSPISRKNWNVVCNRSLEIQIQIWFCKFNWMNQWNVKFRPNYFASDWEWWIFSTAMSKLKLIIFFKTNFDDTRYFDRFCDFVAEFSVRQTDQNKAIAVNKDWKSVASYNKNMHETYFGKLVISHNR